MGDLGPGGMPPDMFLNCNEENKRQKEQIIWSQNVQISRNRIRDRDRNGSGLASGNRGRDGGGRQERIRDWN